MFSFFFPPFKIPHECGAMKKSNRNGSDHCGRKVLMFLATWLPLGGLPANGATKEAV